MDIAFVSEFVGANRVFCTVDPSGLDAPVQRGDVLPMTTGYCEHVVLGRLPELIPDTSDISFAQSIPETASVPIGAHLCVPIRLGDGRIFGTFCCLSYRPRPELENRDLDLVRTFAAVVASELTADLGASRERRLKKEALRAAIRAGDPQIVFQPIVRLADMSVAGVEALSRFQSEPKRSPDKWFADANAAGIGPEVEILAVRKALAEAGSLPPGIALNVNISPNTLVSSDIGAVLRGFEPSCIVVEITEHVPIDDYAPLLAALRPLREAGIRVAIDDAGAGYSSLRHVLTLRPDIIKFDVSLTRNINTDPRREAMVAALAEFANRTATKVVAEGVETDAEVEVLRRLRIEKAQGYRFGRPQKLSALLPKLK